MSVWQAHDIFRCAIDFARNFGHLTLTTLNCGATDAMKEVVKSRMLSFGEVGNRVDYEPLPLETIAQQYAEASAIN